MRLRSATNAETTHQAQLTSVTLTRNSFGEENVRTYTWAATLTNAANATAQSEWQRIDLCDAPSRVGLVSPLAGANTSSDVVFSWDASTVELGFPCVESGAGKA